MSDGKIATKFVRGSAAERPDGKFARFRYNDVGVPCFRIAGQIAPAYGGTGHAGGMSGLNVARIIPCVKGIGGSNVQSGGRGEEGVGRRLHGASVRITAENDVKAPVDIETGGKFAGEMRVFVGDDARTDAGCTEFGKHFKNAREGTGVHGHSGFVISKKFVTKRRKRRIRFLNPEAGTGEARRSPAGHRPEDGVGERVKSADRADEIGGAYEIGRRVGHGAVQVKEKKPAGHAVILGW